jgi:hypothetical protein
MYSSNYFTIKTGIPYYYKRRTTLFNLYSLDSLGGRGEITPKLTIHNCEFKYFLKDYDSLINVEEDSFSELQAGNLYIQWG